MVFKPISLVIKIVRLGPQGSPVWIFAAVPQVRSIKQPLYGAMVKCKRSAVSYQPSARQGKQ